MAPITMEPMFQHSHTSWGSFLLTVFIGGLIGYIFHGWVRSKHKDRLRNIPGRPTDMKKRILDALGSPLQDFSPVDAIHQHLAGFHFYCGAVENQVW